MMDRPRQSREKFRVRSGLRAIAFVAALATLFCAGCNANAGSDQAQSGKGSGGSRAMPQGAEPVDLDPKNFTTEIDNPYWPMDPGTRWTYRETARTVPG